MFMENLKETLNEEFNESVTENGAVGYRTTGKELLDLNFSISSMRNMSEDEIVEKFKKAFYEHKLLAVKWLFYVRDVREGLGERRLFRVCMKYLAENHATLIKKIDSNRSTTMQFFKVRGCNRLYSYGECYKLTVPDGIEIISGDIIHRSLGVAKDDDIKTTLL